MLLNSILTSNLKINIINTFGYQCAHCNNVVYSPVWNYVGIVHGYNETHVTCPHCNKLNIIRQKSVIETIKTYKHLTLQT